MRYEVECKFYVDDIDAVVAAVRTVGARALGEQRQSDTYFTHPCRDFGETDEALRLRTIDGRHVLTYKGPKIDATSKTRREIELPLAGEDGDAMSLMCGEWLHALGFRPLRTICKCRQRYHLQRDGRSFELDLDRVEGLGAFLEVETVSDQGGLDAARASLSARVGELGVVREERRSYLELLREQESSQNPPPE